MFDTLGSASGYLVCEQHLKTTVDVVGPIIPAIRFEPTELLAAAGDPRVLFYRENVVRDPDGRQAALARRFGCRGAPRF